MTNEISSPNEEPNKPEPIVVSRTNMLEWLSDNDILEELKRITIDTGTGIYDIHERLWFYTYGERIHQFHTDENGHQLSQEVWMPRSSQFFKDKEHCKRQFEELKQLGTDEIRDITMYYVNAMKVNSDNNNNE